MLARLRAETAFTLVELLIIILIVAALIAVSAPSFLGQTGKAHESVARQYLTTAYHDAAASAVDHNGNFVDGSFDVAALAAVIHQGEPELTVTPGTCPGSAAAETVENSRIIFVDTSQTHDRDLLLCNDPDHQVYTLKVVNGQLQPITTSGGSGGNGGGGSGGNGPVDCGSSTLTGGSPSTAPSNDDLANAYRLSGTGGSKSEAFQSATAESGEPYIFGAGQGQDTVWFCWQAPSSGNYQLDTFGSNFGDNDDTTLSVYTVADPTSPTISSLSSAINSNDDFGSLSGITIPPAYSSNPWESNNASAFVFAASADTVYWIQVASYSGSSTGSVAINWASSSSDASPAPPGGGTPVLSGNPAAGETLTVDPGSWTGSPSFDYDWQICDSDLSSCDDNVGPDQDTFVVPDGEVGQVVRVVVQASNSVGGASAYSNSLTINDGTNLPPSGGTPTISGDDYAGQTLTAAHGSWLHAPSGYAYQWQICNSALTSCSNVGSNQTTYVIPSGHVGDAIRVQVTASNSFGSNTAASDAITVATVPINPACGGGTNGNYDDIAGAYELDGVPALSPGKSNYQATFESGEPYPNGASGATWTIWFCWVAPSDGSYQIDAFGTRFFSFQTDQTDMSVYTAQNPSSPSVSHLTLVDENDAYYNYSDAGDLVLPSGYPSGSYNQASAVIIDGDAGTTYWVQISGAHANAFYSGPIKINVHSVSVPPANNPSSPPTISSSSSTTTPVVGDTLTAGHGGWAHNPTGYGYQWQSSSNGGSTWSDIGGATSATHVVTGADVGKALRVTVTASNGSGSAAASSAATPPASDGGGTPFSPAPFSVSGGPIVYGILTHDTCFNCTGNDRVSELDTVNSSSSPFQVRSAAYPGNMGYPTWNFNHTKIAFIEGFADGETLWTMDADGSNAQQVSDFGFGFAAPPRFSPNGSKILVGGYDSSHNPDLYVFNSTDSYASGTLLAPLAEVSAYIWDGSNKVVADLSNYSLARFSSDGSNVVTILDSGYGVDTRSLALSWDGTTLAFACDNFRDVCTAPYESDSLLDVAYYTQAGNVGDLAYSPDGKLAFSLGTFDSSDDDVVIANGSATTVVTGGSACTGGVYGPSWSADGSKLMIKCSHAEGGSGYGGVAWAETVATVSASGSGLAELTPNDPGAEGGDDGTTVYGSWNPFGAPVTTLDVPAY